MIVTTPVQDATLGVSITMDNVWLPPESTTNGVLEDTMENPGVALETDWTVHDAGPKRVLVYDSVHEVENDCPAFTVPPGPPEEVQQGFAVT